MVSPNKHTTLEAESGTSSTVLGYANLRQPSAGHQIKTYTAELEKNPQQLSQHLTSGK